MAERTGKYVEIDAELLGEFQAMCGRNGTTFRFEIEDAMRRHLAYPPARGPEPYPEEGVEEGKKPRRKRGG